MLIIWPVWLVLWTDKLANLEGGLDFDQLSSLASGDSDMWAGSLDSDKLACLASGVFW